MHKIDYLLEQAAVHNCRRWLLDARRRINTDKDGAQWMVASFLPGAGVTVSAGAVGSG